MIQLRTVVSLADNTGVKKLRLIHVHGGSKHVLGHIGDIITASVIQVDPQSQFKKGDMVKAVIVRTKKETRRSDGSYIRFDDNAVVIIESLKNQIPLGTRIFGPVAREIKDKGLSKIASLAPELL